jgi:hypothetical protein
MPSAGNTIAGISCSEQSRNSGGTLVSLVPSTVVGKGVLVSDPTWLTPPLPRMLTGEEVISGAGVSVRDFWAWSMSDLRANTVRSVLAEFLVARAMGADLRPRVEWDAYDVLTPDGYQLEVKSGAYLQAWNQPKHSTITFGGLRARTWSPEAGYSVDGSYNADAYVFALMTAKQHDWYDALDVDQWAFWVLTREALARTGQRSVRLARVEALAGPALTYSELPSRLREILISPSHT